MTKETRPYDFAKQLLASQTFFERSTSVLTEADSGFRPREEMMTVARQVAHTAQTLDWFIEGVSRPEGFDLNFRQFTNWLCGNLGISGNVRQQPLLPIRGGLPMIRPKIFSM